MIARGRGRSSVRSTDWLSFDPTAKALRLEKIDLTTSDNIAILSLGVNFRSQAARTFQVPTLATDLPVRILSATRVLAALSLQREHAYAAEPASVPVRR